MEVQLSHPLEDAFGMLGVSSVIRGEDQEIIYVNYEPSFGNHVMEGVVHESLESGGGVIRAEEHDCRFKEAFMSDEGAFPLICIFDADIVIAPSNVEFGEDLSSFEFIDKV
jgi:hypothetical protein